MKQYMLSVHGDEADFGSVSPDQMQEMFEAVNKVNTEMQEKGAWVFGGGLELSSTATVVDNTGDKLVTTDGPFIETKECLGGFWVITAKDLDEALAWATKASKACQGTVEVRPFQDEPDA